MSRLSNIINRYKDIKDVILYTQILMTQSISKFVREYNDIDNIIFCSDGGSWRNTISIPDFIKKEHADDVSTEYKGNRVKSDEFEWDVFFEGYNEYISKLRNIGITVCHAHGIEGDDWISYWSNELFNDNTSVIIWSTDNDLKQLLKYDKDNGTFVCTYDTKKGFSFCEDVNAIISRLNENADDALKFLFNSYYESNSNIITSLITKSKKDANFVSPSHIVIEKIFNGDAGDNVYPILQKETNGRKFKIRKTDLNESLDIYDEAAVESYLSNLMNNKFFKGTIKKTFDDVIKHFKLNRKLVVLNKVERPQNIQEILDDYDTYDKNNNVTELINILKAEEHGLTSILNVI